MAMEKGIIWNTRGEDVERWRGVFLEEMRLRGASGHQMGEAWATIEAHVQETGDSLVDAFGDPVTYAAELTDDQRSPRAIALTYGGMVLAIIGGYMTAFMPLVGLREPVDVSWGSLALVPFGLVAMLGIVVSQRRMQWHKGQGFLLFMVTFMGFQMGSQALRDWTTTAIVAPAWILWTLCFLCLSLATVAAWRWTRDRTIDPRTGQTPSMVPAFWWWVLAAMPLWGPGALLFFRWLAHR
ncbi:hypothetical protein ACTQ49_01420 [Luteococcus sp. Sow4_B9]|uniref:hypothetical protein n=1 Tax=Luteococcus sp. Sow4_B9 TaxID=3438792 RepID=UPI003F9B2759